MGSVTASAIVTAWSTLALLLGGPCGGARFVPGRRRDAGVARSSTAEGRAQCRDRPGGTALAPAEPAPLIYYGSTRQCSHVDCWNLLRTCRTVGTVPVRTVRVWLLGEGCCAAPRT